MVLIVQVFQWVFETDFFYMFCKTVENKRIILKVHTLNLKSYVLVDPTSLIEEMVEELQDFLLTQSFCSQLVKKKRFGTFFDASGLEHREFQFVEISHPSNGKNLYTLKYLLNNFERKFKLSLKTFHMNIDPIVRLFQCHPNLTPCMFLQIDTEDPLIRLTPPVTIRVSKGIRRSVSNYSADTFYSLPISKIQHLANPPPFNFPLRVVAFDFECTGANYEKDVIYQVSIVFETVFLPEGGNVRKESQNFLLNVGNCNPIVLDDGGKVNVSHHESEKMLLMKMMSLLTCNEWDCITGFNIYGFDFPMLEARLRKHGLLTLLTKWNRIHSTNKRIGTFHKKTSGKGEGYLAQVFPQMMGRFHLDLLPVIRKNYRLKSYSLGAVSTKFLGTTKIDIPFDCDHTKPCAFFDCKTQKNLYKKQTPDAFAEIGLYCVVDSLLCLALVNKLNVIGNQIEFANIVYFPLDRLFTTGEMKKIAAQIFVNGIQLGFVFEDKPYVENSKGLDLGSGKKYQGGLVLEPKTGAYMDNFTAILDFARYI